MDSLPAAIDLPEAIVGTSDVYSISLPELKTASGDTVIVTPSLAMNPRQNELAIPDEQPATLVEMYPRVLTSSATAPLQIIFAPKNAGRRSATLTLTVRHQDGRSAERKIILNFVARTTAQAPLMPATLVERVQSGTKDAEPHATAPNSGVNAPAVSAGELGNRIVLLTTTLKDGVTKAESKATFTRKATDMEVWLEIVGAAVSLGIGAAAGSVAAQCESALISRSVAKVIRNGEVLEEVAARVTPASKRVAESLKSLMTKVGSEAGKRVAALGKTPPMTAKNFRIEFFDRQRTALDEAATGMLGAFKEHKSTIDSSMSSVLLVDGADASEVVEQIVTASHAVAKEQQERVSSMHWIEEVARATQGAETVVDAEGMTQSVTNMKKSDGNGLGDYADGVLELVVSGRVGEEIIVHHARLNGISTESGAVVLDEVLIGQRIPIRLIHEGRKIDIDESGRVRIATHPSLDRGPLDLRNAEKLASIVLSRSLRNWRITEVASDAKDE